MGAHDTCGEKVAFWILFLYIVWIVLVVLAVALFGVFLFLAITLNSYFYFGAAAVCFGCASVCLRMW